MFDQLPEHFWLALGLCTFAGLATGVGSFIAFAFKKENKRFLSAALGFSAGAMIYVAFVEVFPEALEILTDAQGAEQA
jgi:ZIP family zinc transporter